MKTIVNINGKTKEEVLISKLEIENRDLKRQIIELNQNLQLQQTAVMCCVDYAVGITINKVYQVIGFTNDKQMYVINNDYDVYSCYGVDLFKHST